MPTPLNFELRASTVITTYGALLPAQVKMILVELVMIVSDQEKRIKDLESLVFENPKKT